MVLRSPSLGGDNDEQRRQNVVTGVKKAREALGLDMTDGRSWYVLGNAYLTQFFSIAQEEETLQKALKAYTKAESLGNRCPDLYFNRANVQKYYENYQTAIEDYERAAKLDPSLPATEAIESIESLANKMASMIRTKKGVKPKRLDAIAKSIPNEEKIGEKETTMIDALVEGENTSKTLLLKVISPVSKDCIPISLVMCDRDTNFCTVSIYNVAPEFLGAIKVGDLVQLISPMRKTISLKSKSTSYTCLQIYNPEKIAINGSPPDKKYFAAAKVVNQIR